MKAEEWERLGEALKANAPFLEGMALADGSGLPLPERMTKGLSWLMSKGLIEEESSLLYMGGLLLDVGAQLSIQGFERVAPDLEETLIALEELCESYHAAKAADAHDEAERHFGRLTYNVRQIVIHLRNEHSTTRAFIEGGYGFSARLSDRLRDIKNATARLRRLHDKLGLFSHAGLLHLTRSDRALGRLLLDGLLQSVSRNRLALDALIGRLDRLSLAVRKRNHMHQVAQAVDLYLQMGNSIDLAPLLERADATNWARAAPMATKGYLFCDETCSEHFAVMEQLMAALPSPKVRLNVEEAPQARLAKVVPFEQSAPQKMAEAFAHSHLEKMLNALIATGEPQSALEYWAEHGDPGVVAGIWLYALDGYVQLQAALSKTRGQKINYRVKPSFEPYARVSANRRVLDLVLERVGRAG